ncbi:hypothetical protein SAY87_009589 [Trapa incisa]|uniref:Uncharacterized protein n=1 Tax=Trapa incisa TaxID=236973 RepID=A0AAN7JZ02_9MYRT|nr:hypothetical protein SAY87_009589 [Trapa incisa]
MLSMVTETIKDYDGSLLEFEWRIKFLICMIYSTFPGTPLSEVSSKILEIGWLPLIYWCSSQLATNELGFVKGLQRHVIRFQWEEVPPSFEISRKFLIPYIVSFSSQGLTQDPTTRRIWFGIATAHDFESHDDITEERLYQNIFSSHFGQLAIIFRWTFGNLFHVAWKGNFEAWVQDPLHVRPIAHTIWDPHFGQPTVEAFTRGGALGPVNIAYSQVYQ